MPVANIMAVMAFMASRSPGLFKLRLQGGGITSAGCLIDRNVILQLLHLHFKELQAGQLRLAVHAEVFGVVFGAVYDNFWHFELSICKCRYSMRVLEDQASANPRLNAAV